MNKKLDFYTILLSYFVIQCIYDLLTGRFRIHYRYSRVQYA